MVRYVVWFSLLILPIVCNEAFQQDVQYFIEMLEEEIRNARNFTVPTSADEYTPNSPTLNVNGGTFDFIVIGAGASGATLAARLTEVTKWKTLLLEAGCLENDFVDIPAMQGYTKSTKYNWGFASIPQNSSCLGYKESRCPQPRGKGLGGTTLINGILYVRPRAADFDDIRKQGNPGWDYKSVLKYFKKSEKLNFKGGDKKYHGYRGHLDVNHLPIQSDQAKAFIEAHKELGVKEVDYNGAESFGVARMQSNIRNGRRLSSYKAFLEPVLHRKNLIIQCNSYVIKVLPSDDKQTVLYVQNGKLFYALARKEIILSGGSFGTPHILMLSGIGPKDHLLKLKIPVVKNLAVGHNLRDHLSFTGIMFRTNSTFVDKGTKEFMKEYLQGTGPYTITAGIEAISFYDTPSNDEKRNPNVEFLQMTSPLINEDTQKILELNDETFDAFFKGVNGNNSFMVQVIGTRPKSRGSVRLASKHPFSYPLIDTQYLTDVKGDDINEIYEGIQFLEKLEETKAFKKIDAKLIYPRVPACKDTIFKSREYWYCHIRQLSFNIYHPVGTAKMGPSPKNGDVVDARFKVYGFDSLRVVDASIFPNLFSGHPAAACMMIAEKAYDTILEDYGLDHLIS